MAALIKPCPFDGNKDLLGAIVNSRAEDGSVVWWAQDIDKCLVDLAHTGEFSIFCTKCNVHGPVTADGGSMQQAIDLWNKRADPACECGKPLSPGKCPVCDRDE